MFGPKDPMALLSPSALSLITLEAQKNKTVTEVKNTEISETSALAMALKRIHKPDIEQKEPSHLVQQEAFNDGSALLFTPSLAEPVNYQALGKETLKPLNPILFETITLPVIENDPDFIYLNLEEFIINGWSIDEIRAGSYHQNNNIDDTNSALTAVAKTIALTEKLHAHNENIIIKYAPSILPLTIEVDMSKEGSGDNA